MNLSKFRGYKKEKITPGWTVTTTTKTLNGETTTEQVLHIDGVKRGDDIITKKSYKNFDMRFEWKVSEGGNSGVFYHVGMGDKAASKSGIEYQVLDDKGHHDGQNPLTSAGSIYALYAPKDYPQKGRWRVEQKPYCCQWSKNRALLERRFGGGSGYQQRRLGKAFGSQQV